MILFLSSCAACLAVGFVVGVLAMQCWEQR
jgi:hypothetical protein